MGGNRNGKIYGNSERIYREQLLTIEDLQTFKMELLAEFKKLLVDHLSPRRSKWLKSYEVRELLNISAGTLQSLRATGTLPFTKVGGAIYYDYADIEKMLEKRKLRQ